MTLQRVRIMRSFQASECRAWTGTAQDLALGLPVWDFTSVRFHTTTGRTGATCLEGGMRNNAEKFWAQVEMSGPDECWLWTGPVRPKGYGMARWDGHTHNASRLAWILTAQITPPKHLFVCHTCHNPPCCNPNHLYLGNAQTNNLDTVVSGRHSKTRRTHCRRGHPYDAVNIYPGLSETGRPHRDCRICKRERDTARRTRLKLQRWEEKVKNLGDGFSLTRPSDARGREAVAEYALRFKDYGTVIPFDSESQRDHFFEFSMSEGERASYEKVQRTVTTTDWVPLSPTQEGANNG